MRYYIRGFALGYCPPTASATLNTKLPRRFVKPRNVDKCCPSDTLSQEWKFDLIAEVLLVSDCIELIGVLCVCVQLCTFHCQSVSFTLKLHKCTADGGHAMFDT